MHYVVSCLGTRNKLIGVRRVAVVIVYRISLVVVSNIRRCLAGS